MFAEVLLVLGVRVAVVEVVLWEVLGLDEFRFAAVFNAVLEDGIDDRAGFVEGCEGIDVGVFVWI